MVFAKPDEGIYAADEQQSAAALNRSVETCVNHCPAQYQWEYKRFRKQPKGAKKIY